VLALVFGTKLHVSPSQTQSPSGDPPPRTESAYCLAFGKIRLLRVLNTASANPNDSHRNNGGLSSFIVEVLKSPYLGRQNEVSQSMYAAGNRNSESLTLLTTDNATTLLKSQISNLIISSSDLISRKNICPNNIARRLASFCSRSNPTVAMKNNPTLAGASWAHQFLWPYLREGYLYSASVALLAFASVALFAGTAEGVLELCACCMLCGMDVFGIVYEAVSLAKDRRARAVDFLGNVQVKRSDGEWESVSGFDLKPGDVR